MQRRSLDVVFDAEDDGVVGNTIKGHVDVEKQGSNFDAEGERGQKCHFQRFLSPHS